MDWALDWRRKLPRQRERNRHHWHRQGKREIAACKEADEVVPEPADVAVLRLHLQEADEGVGQPRLRRSAAAAGEKPLCTAATHANTTGPG